MPVERFRSIEDMNAAPIRGVEQSAFDRFIRHCARYRLILRREERIMVTRILAALALVTVGTVCVAQTPPLMLDHAWIVVTTGAPERALLERAGFRIAPTVNRHDGQGTAAVTVEFLNGINAEGRSS
jgi:hypothetical protein